MSDGLTIEQELLFLREQNSRLIHALRRLERENDQLERAYKKKTARWKHELENMLKGIKNKKEALKELGPLKVPA